MPKDNLLGFGIFSTLRNGHRNGRNTALATTKRLKITRAEVRQAEGRHGELKRGIFTGSTAEEQADRLLREIARTAPDTGGYYKVDVEFTLSNGQHIKQRHDVKRNDPDGTIREHAIRFYRYLATGDPQIRKLHEIDQEQEREILELLEALTGQPYTPRSTLKSKHSTGPLGLGFLKDNTPIRSAFQKPQESTTTTQKPSLPDISRDDAIQRIRTALKQRSGKSWSVTGGRGTAWGWISIKAPPARMPDFIMNEDDQRELGRLLGLNRPAHRQGESIPASKNFYWQFIDMAEGRPPRVIGERYWD